MAQRALSRRVQDVRALVEYLAPVVRRAVLRYLHAWSLCSGVTDFEQGRNELFQEVMMELLVKEPPAIARFRPEVGSLKAFAYAVASKRCHTVVRGKPVPRDDAALKDIADPSPSQERRVVEADLLEALYDRLVEVMSPVDALIFRLSFVEDLDPAEVAKQMGLTPAQVHMRRFRLRRKVQAIVVALERPSAAGKKVS